MSRCLEVSGPGSHLSLSLSLSIIGMYWPWWHRVSGDDSRVGLWLRYQTITRSDTRKYNSPHRLNTKSGSRRLFTFDSFNKIWPQPIIVYAWDCFDDKLFIENSKDKRYHVSYLISNISWLYISIEKVYNPLLQAMKGILKVDDSFKFPVRQTLTNGQAWRVAAGGHFDHFTSD